MYPSAIILNTHGKVKELREKSKEILVIEGRHFVCDILEDLLDCLTHLKTAGVDLAGFVTEIRSGKYEYGYSLVKTEIASIVFDLGMDLFRQLRFWHLYLPDGKLPYYYLPIRDPYFNDVVLLRIHELT